MAEIKAQYENWRTGATTTLKGRWKMVPAVRGGGAAGCGWGRGWLLGRLGAWA